MATGMAAPMIRVLVVDDSVVVRKLVTDVLEADAGITVAGIAANGKIALQKIEQLNPDIVTLDIEMPEMDGLETIVEIRKRWPTLPVIMFSTLTAQGAAATLEALARGATDYVTKPANVGSVLQAQHRVRDDLIPRIHGLCGRRAIPTAAARPSGTASTAPGTPVSARPAVVAPKSAFGAPVPVAKAPRTGAPLPVELLAIGSSTGGPNALVSLIPQLPADLGVPVVITQHMPPVFTRLLAERLDGLSGLTVREATDGAVLAPNVVWLAPGDTHMAFAKRGTSVVVALNKDAPEHSCRPAVDVMLRSAHAIFGGRVLTVILTGMGRDGTLGAEILSRSGGSVFAQDAATSVVWGMPGFVAGAGLADRILPLGEIADAIVERVDAGRGTRNNSPTRGARGAAAR
ncbi:MAG: chemotaxis response regulator protein-glutamate methylesterase [Gemmatimonadota bacterium]